MRYLIRQFPLGASPQSAFTIPAGYPSSGRAVIATVHGQDVPFTMTNATTVTLKTAAFARAIVEIWEDDKPNSVGNVASAVLDFPSINTLTSAELTIACQGAELGDIVSLGLPSTAPAGITYDAFVSAANTIKVRASNITAGAIDPPSGTYRVSASKS